jgi:aminobenzoyl-glutamate utilization protein A
MKSGGCLEGVDVLLGMHLGLGHPTGTIVAGMDEFLAATKFRATFTGEAAHAAKNPSEGANAIQAAVTAVNNLHSLPRHGESLTRVNVGRIEGGVATNIVAPSASLEGEIRAGDTDALEELYHRTERVVEHSAEMHGVEVESTVLGHAPSASSDPVAVDAVAAAADRYPDVKNIRRESTFGASEDATTLMRCVQDGGIAGYIGIGTDHPSGHHTKKFDIDETSIKIGADVLTATFKEIKNNMGDNW